jgi:hypothetical protein
MTNTERPRGNATAALSWLRGVMSKRRSPGLPQTAPEQGTARANLTRELGWMALRKQVEQPSWGSHTPEGATLLAQQRYVARDPNQAYAIAVDLQEGVVLYGNAALVELTRKGDDKPVDHPHTSPDLG